MKSWFAGTASSVNSEIITPFSNAEQIIYKYNQAIEHNSLTQQGWQRLIAQCDDGLASYLTNIKGSIASMSAYSVSLQGNITGYTKITQAMKQYNALGAVSQKEQQNFATAVSLTNAKLGSYLTGLNGAKASLSGYGVSLIASTAKTVGLTIATTALNAALTFGISAIITGVVSAFATWINSSKEITEAAEEAKDKIASINDDLKTNTETVENAKQRYAELAQEVENLGKVNQSRGSLSTDEYEEFLDLSNQLADVFPQLSKNYDDNGNAILNLSGDVDTIVGSLDDLLQKEKDLANQKIIDEFPDVYKGYVQDLGEAESEVKSAKSEFDKINNAYQQLQNSGGMVQAFDKDSLLGTFENEDGEEATVELANYIQALEDLNIAYEKTNITRKNAYGGDEVTGYLITATGDIDTAFTSKLETARKNLQYAEQQLEGEKSSIDSYLNTWLQSEFTYNQIDDSGLQTAVQDMIMNFDFSSLPDNIDKNDWNAVSEYLRRNILFAINDVQDNPEISKAISEVFTNQDLTPEEKANYLQQIKDYFDDLLGEDNAISISLQPQIKDTDALQKSIKKTADRFNDSDKIKDFFDTEGINTDEEVNDFNKVTEGINDADKAIQKWNEHKKASEDSFEIPDADTLKQQISDLNSAIDSIQSAYDTLNSAVEEYNSNGGQLSIDTIQSLLSLSDEYLACLQVENGQLSLNADAMAQLAQAKLDEAQATAVTQAMTELQAIANGEAAQSTTNYITGNAALMSSLAQLSGSYEGVAQAAMTAAQAQELSAQISAAASKDKTATENVMKGLDNKLKLIQATKTTISAGNFAKVAKKSSSSKSGSSSKNYETELKKQLESIKTEYEKGSITLDEYYEKSLSLIKQYYDEGKIEASDFYDNNKSLLDDYLKYLEIAYKRGSMPYGEYFAKYLKAVQDCYDKGAISTEEYWNYNKELLDDYVDSAKKILDNLYDHKSMQAAGVSDLKQYLTTCYEMIKSFYNQGKISAYDYYSYLSDFYDYQISVYDKVIDAVTNKLDDQIDALEKQKDQIEKNYKAQIDVLEKEKDALEAENDARQDAIDLQKALYEMNRAQNQRTDLVYKDGQMVYVADQQGIRDKKDELDDLEYQRKIKEIEKRISSLEKTMDSLTDGIDQQIEDLNNYKDQWEDVKNKFIEQQNELLAEQIVGKDWEIDIQNMRMEALVEFTNKYIAMQQAQADAAVAAANKIVEAQRSIAAMQNTTPTTISTPSTSNSSSGGSGGSNKNTTFKSNNIKAEVRSVVSPGYKTSGEASSKISSYNGNGVMKKNGKWYVYKKYASGTDNAEKGWHIVSEDNIGDEIVIDNNGNAVIPHGEQLYNFQGGEQVIPANESKEIIENQGNVEKIPDKVVLGDGTVLTPVSHVMEISDSIRQSMMKNVAFPDNIGQRNYENLMKNANNISNVNNNQPTDNSVSIGEIHLHEVQNVDEFSKAIIHKFPGKMRQALYSR